MGGHGGLNILPQKRWNVYNFDNREKVKKDEEEAAKEEQIKREQSRKRDAEFRLQLLRQARGLATPPGPHGSVPPTEPQGSASAPPEAAEKEAEPVSPPDSEPEPERKSKFNHINLFEGIKIFDLPKVEKKRKGEDEDDKRSKKMKKEAPPRVVLPEDEKYRMGYGVAGKDVKLPWYMSKRSKYDGEDKDDDSDDDYKSREVKGGAKKKTLQELREERLQREKREKERERALLNKGRRVVPELPDRYFHRRGGK